MASALYKLAHKIYQQTENSIWIGGKGHGGAWPLSESVNWTENTRWMISPEIEMGGYKLRLCISKTHESYPNNTHRIRVFVDGELKNPGGMSGEITTFKWFTESWDVDAAKAVWNNEGRSGPIKSPERFLAEALRHQQKALPGAQPPLICSMCKQALEEIEQTMKGSKGGAQKP